HAHCLQRRDRDRTLGGRHKRCFDRILAQVRAEVIEARMTLGSIAFAFLAGVLSTLSPCVLPLLPAILGPAVREHRLGPAALAAGLALSFVTIGLCMATIGYGIGLDAGFFRLIAAFLLITIGLILMVPTLQTQFAAAAAPVSAWSENTFGGFATG